MFKGAVALRINPTIYCVNFKFAKRYIVYKFFNATAPLIIDLASFKCDNT